MTKSMMGMCVCKMLASSGGDSTHLRSGYYLAIFLKMILT